MTNEKTAQERAVEEAKDSAEKLVIKWLATRKTLTRRDNLEAVENLGDAEDWGEFELLMIMARKATGKSWDELNDTSQEELEKAVL